MGLISFGEGKVFFREGRLFARPNLLIEDFKGHR
jgi:hypothetical protein